MAISTINSLFPPYIDSFMPAFNKEGSARVYFSLSSYNSLEDIKYIHVSLTSQLTNENALKEGQVKIIPTIGSEDFSFDSEIGLYYIVIRKTEVINDTWLNNQYYKVQIRFDNNPSGSIPPTDTKSINTWLTEYNKYFSEWSTICLLRPIVKPDLFLRLFDTANSSDENETIILAFNKGIIPLSGFVQFGDGSTAETDTLQSYYIELLEEDTDDVVLTTEIIYTSQNINPNSIEYKLDTQGVDTTANSKFRIRINYTTRNLYTSYKDYNIELAGYVDYPSFQPTVLAEVNNDTGIATISIENGNTVFGTLYVRRASSITNYKTWEDLYVIPVGGAINLTITDNTVGSMTWYRYSAQLENSVGGMTEIYYSEKICPDFYDAILSRGNTQFTIQFNHKIASFKPVVNRVKIDTLGGKYPKFAENAAMNYKQFQITGLISSQEDSDNLFLDPNDMPEYSNWQVYNENNRINEGYDYYWEREFREALVKWLNDGEPKLYRSQTEGNMAVMLTDISLTPNSTLSRRIWDFSATVYEIADGYSLNTLDSLGIYNVVKPSSAVISGGGGGDEDEYVVVKKPGQIYMVATDIFDKNDIINNYIAQEMFAQYSGIRAEFDPSNFILSNVKIFFHNKPHLFARTANNNLTLISPSNIGNYDEENLVLGYTFSLSNSADMRSSFFVDPRGFYQIPDNIDVSTLYFPQEDDVVTVEYIITYREYAGSSTMIKSQTVEKVVLGQETRIFEPNQYVGDYIRRQYLYTTEDYYQKMNWWKGISIETAPNTMVSIHYKGKDNPDIYQIGFTGVLNLIQDFPITTLAFLGRRLIEIPQDRLKYAEEWEYVIDNTQYNSFEEINSPKVHTVYHVGDFNYIYYIDQEMHLITLDSDGTGIAEVPVNASINYIGDIIRSTLH